MHGLMSPCGGRPGSSAVCRGLSMWEPKFAPSSFVNRRKAKSSLYTPPWDGLPLLGPDLSRSGLFHISFFFVIIFGNLTFISSRGCDKPSYQFLGSSLLGPKMDRCPQFGPSLGRIDTLAFLRFYLRSSCRYRHGSSNGTLFLRIAEEVGVKLTVTCSTTKNRKLFERQNLPNFPNTFDDVF
ncbi:hypothetical protein F2Q69_00007300 [Brassica cretica]|uniref:Uncharacterized protein n=1 Tax=Brassica cretica TaxID=69181 RepID=A0A8S9PM59_BRACR|nr:hypothetical protein F2Q69_00007300 [Brassica cretica]